MSLVGTVLSFEDSYYDYCGGAHPSIDTRFTTVNLSQPGEIRYAETQDTPQMDVDLEKRGKVVKLTDFFSERDILRAMLVDPVVATALSKAAAQAPPRTLAELVELFAEDDYELGDSQFELRPDFLTRFAFHHIEGDKVAIRIGLPPHYGANQALSLQIGLLLPIPENLRRALLLADSGKRGFLMKDARSIARNQITKFRFRMRHNEKIRK
jgi:hypothetical protein